MDFISGLAVLLLTLLGYSYGSALAGRRREVRPAFVDLPTTAMLCAGALISRALLGKWCAIVVLPIAGLLVGALTMFLRRVALPDAGRAPPSTHSGALFAKLGRSWVSISRRAGDFQARLVLLWFYIIFVAPVGLLYRLFRDPLNIRKRREDSSWQQRESSTGGLDDARRQY
jgi:membrane associated rhomboid family serine protease